MYNFVKLCLMIFVSWFFLYGCSAIHRPTYSPHPEVVLQQDISLPQPVLTLPKQKQILSPSGKAVNDLIARANRLKLSGELETAAASLERAVRISPKDPIPWQHLAQIRLQQKDTGQAEALAAKSNSLAKGSKRIIQRNWQIIEQARCLAGDIKETLSTESKIDDLDTIH